METETSKPIRTFEIWPSERCFRFKEEAMHNHAPQQSGIYELVTFDEAQKASVVYAGLTTDKTIFTMLYEHWDGKREPAVQDLLKKYPNLYFSYVVESDAKSPEDMQDLFWGIVQEDKPELLDYANLQHSGRFSDIKVKDKSLL
jgi:hypothetical protein